MEGLTLAPPLTQILNLTSCVCKAELVVRSMQELSYARQSPLARILLVAGAVIAVSREQK